jgi:putative nucleotidyltransferase-like protein
VAAKYAYPYGSSPFDNEDFSHIDLPRLIRFLGDNRVLLTFYENFSKNPRHVGFAELKTLLRNAIDQRTELMMDVDEGIETLNHLLLTNGFRYMLPKFTFFHREEHDIDLLVSTADFSGVIGLLQSEGYKITSIQSPWKVTLAKWVEGKRKAAHVHSRIHWYTWDPFEFVPSGNLWRRAQAIDLGHQVNVLIPCAEDCILILAAHAMIENREITLSDVFQLDGIVRRFPAVDWQETADLADKRGWCYDLLTFLRIVNQMTYSLYGKLIAPDAFFSYAEKKIPSEERLLRGLASRTTAFSVPWHYAYSQRGLSFVNVFLRNYKSAAIPKIARGFAHRTAYELRRDKGE